MWWRTHGPKSISSKENSTIGSVPLPLRRIGKLGPLTICMYMLYNNSIQGNNTVQVSSSLGKLNLAMTKKGMGEDENTCMSNDYNIVAATDHCRSLRLKVWNIPYKY